VLEVKIESRKKYIVTYRERLQTTATDPGLAHLGSKCKTELGKSVTISADSECSQPVLLLRMDVLFPVNKYIDSNQISITRDLKCKGAIGRIRARLG
jgi:hypothetical protein